jgi:hypothetical protein
MNLAGLEKCPVGEVVQNRRWELSSPILFVAYLRVGHSVAPCSCSSFLIAGLHQGVRRFGSSRRQHEFYEKMFTKWT